MTARIPERPISVVPRWVLAAVALTLAAQIGLQAGKPPPLGRASALDYPPPTPVLKAASLGEPIALSQMLVLSLQAYDNQPGISIPFAQLDYGKVIAWLTAALELDPVGQYPLMMAAQVYGQVADEARQRVMCGFVHAQFLRDPDRRWRWLAHCAIMAKHRLHDMALAMQYAEDITRHAGRASNWARQMRIFLLEEMGEREEAAILLGGLLAGNEVTDPREIHFLTQRLEELKNAGKSSAASKYRQ
jgi:hypothetical protein